MEKVIFEVCAGGYEDCMAASNGGADRIELNNALYLGGLTPSFATVAMVKRDIEIPVIVMIRPRPGGFHYTDSEFELMCLEAHQMLKMGVEGIAFGFLNKDFSIDEKRTAQFTEIIHSYKAEAIFHRAFDLVNDIEQSIKLLIKCGVDRVLTSGLAPTALEGQVQLKYLERSYGHQIEILAGVGINEKNIRNLINLTGIRQFHSSCKVWKEDVTVKNHMVSYSYDAKHELETEYVDENIVKLMSRILKKKI